MKTSRQKAAPIVLVVDDDPIVRLLGREFLEQAGFVVEEAEDGAQALSEFMRVRPDIILLDVIMPGMDGFAACAALRKLPAGELTPVLMVTGLEDTESITRAYEAGATDFMTKPFNAVILHQRIRYMLRASRLREELSRNEASLARAQRIARLGNWEWELATKRFAKMSREAHRIHGLQDVGSDMEWEVFLNSVHPCDRASVQEAFDNVLNGLDTCSIDYRIVLPDGAEHFVHEQAEVACDEAGRAIRLMGTVQDITERKRAEEQIHALAYYDGLTGLPNRRLFQDRVGHAMVIAQRHRRMGAILFLDIDRFKRINDTLGHKEGDLLLRGVGDRLLSCMRKSDSVARQRPYDLAATVSRLGGDEFTLLLSEIADVQDAARVARRILDSLAAPFTLGGREVFITASIGISLFPCDGEDIDTLLKNADIAMYRAKDQGRNTYLFYNQSMTATAFERLTLENDLCKALDREELLLHYQPQVDLRSGRIIGVEALLRWQHPVLGMVSPAEFIPLAEEAGLIIPIGEWVLRTACAQNKSWQESGFCPMRIAVNLSGLQLGQPTLLDTIRRILRDTALDPRYLEVELTESSIMRDGETAIAMLNELKAMGLRLTIDDFGTGYSSLSYLKRFPLDTLKIDRSFVKDITTNADDVAITKAIIAMAHSLELRVIAEGVEMQEQLAILCEHGCDEMQGYLFSKPLPADALARLLSEKHSEARAYGIASPQGALF